MKEGKESTEPIGFKKVGGGWKIELPDEVFTPRATSKPGTRPSKPSE